MYDQIVKPQTIVLDNAPCNDGQGSFPKLPVTFEQYGSNKTADGHDKPVMAILPFFLGSAHAAGHKAVKDDKRVAPGYWDALVGPGEVINTDTHCVVSFEPVCSVLLAQGARRLFSSADAPGLIVDVLAVRAEVADHHGPALRSLVASLFRARADWLSGPATIAPLLTPRLRLPPAEVVRAFEGVLLPDLAANRDWLGGRTPALVATARRVTTVMQRAGLLAADADPLAATAGDALADPRFLPTAT